jgi:hypothetical protein
MLVDLDFIVIDELLHATILSELCTDVKFAS